MADKVILYSYFRSSCSWRARIALAMKNVSYEYKAINLINGEGDQYSEEYKALNPMGVVPALVIDGNTLTQSLAMIEYINETRPGVALLPADPIQRAKARAIAFAIACDIQPVQNLRILKTQGDKKVEWAHRVISEGFKGVERLLAASSGKYCVGDEVSIADICLVPQVYNANRFKVNVSEFPNIARVSAALEELEAFRVSHPSKQPDCPEDLRLA